jgi:2-polyprenyl-6-methoxyphenol hydroxylase-like FAD-dependent oxidoreductase
MRITSVLVSGASVAGPSLALWLSRYGFEVTLVERAPTIRPGGYAVDFRGVAMTVIERTGLLAALREIQTRTGPITLVDRLGRKIASMPDGFTSGELEVMRGDLASILYDVTQHQTEYIFDDSITSITECRESVEVTFERGPRRKFDLVVGADGLHSNVRKLIFGADAEFVHPLGYYISIFSMPNFLNLDHTGLFCDLLGRKVGIFSGRGNGSAIGSFYFASPPLAYDRRDIAQQKQMLRQRFPEQDWAIPRMIKMMDDAPDFYFDSISQVKMDHWCRGRVALLGDAAWCPSPLSGMGTGMAVVGAYVLAGELMEANGDHEVGFTRYQSVMRHYVVQCQKIADGADWFIPSTRWKRWFSSQMWRVLPHTRWRNMMNEVPFKAANSIDLKNYQHS